MSTLTDRIQRWTTPLGPRLPSGSLISPGKADPSSYIPIDRILNPPRNSPSGGVAILVLEAHERTDYTWIAIRVSSGMEPIALADRPQPTRHDAIVDAIEHVPNWNIIRSL